MTIGEGSDDLTELIDKYEDAIESMETPPTNRVKVKYREAAEDFLEDLRRLQE